MRRCRSQLCSSKMLELAAGPPVAHPKARAPARRPGQRMPPHAHQNAQANQNNFGLCCACLTRIPVMICVAMLAYCGHKFSRPTERIMDAAADTFQAGARIFNASANMVEKISDESLRFVDASTHGVRVVDSGGDARSLQAAVGPNESKREIISQVRL